MSEARANRFSLVTQYYPPERGAAQVRLAAVVADLARRGRPVDVVTALPNYPTGRIFDGWSRRPWQRATEGDVTVSRVWVWASMGSGFGRIANYLSFAAMSVPAVLATPRADWVVVEYPTLFGAFPTVLLSSLRRRKVTVIVADLWVDSIVQMGVLSNGRAVSMLRRLERWMLRRADAVTVVTDGVRDAVIAKGVAPSKVAWLPNGADTELFCPGPSDPSVTRSLGVREGEHMVLYAGTHGYAHGLEVVLDAAERLSSQPVRFVLVGGGSEKASLQADAQRRGLTNIEFRDPVAPEEIAVMLRGALCGLATVRAGDVYNSIRSAKMLPVMASGLPVIYAGAGEGAEVIAEAGAGPVVAPGDGEALAGAVMRLIEHPSDAAAMGEAGRAWIEEHLSWHRLVGEWLEQLDRIEHGDPAEEST